MKTLMLFSLSFFSIQTLAAELILPTPKSIYDIKVKTITDQPVSLSQYKGKVLLIVNTASKCGYTPQYAGLQKIYENYKKDGLEILGFPSNDFGGQEPGANKEIKNFCELKYKVTFPLFEKNKVTGKEKQPLYQWLLENSPGAAPGKTSEISWNFEKFIISKDGKVLGRFKSGTTPDSDDLKEVLIKALK